MADKTIGPGTVLAGRFRLEDLLQEAAGAKFWRATDRILARSVAVHVIEADDARAEALLIAARTSATVSDGHFLRVLDAAEEDGVVYVVNEWGHGVSLDRLLEDGPLPPRRAAWVVKEVAEAVSTAHRQGIAHGRLLPENVMVTEAGSVKLIGFVIDAVLHGRRKPLTPGDEPPSEHEADVLNLAALLYATLVAKWPGSEGSRVPPAPREHGRALRPRQVRAGVPRPLDMICDRVLNGTSGHHATPIESAHEICAALSDFIGDPTGAAAVGYEPTSVLAREELAAASYEAVGSTDDLPTSREASTREELPGAEATTAESPAAEATPAETTAVEAAADDATTAVPPAREDDEPGPDAPGDQGAAEPGRPQPDPDATQAGAPVFFDDDNDDVGWASLSGSRGRGVDDPAARRAAPPPPPELPEPEPKPLFAPDPPGGPRPRRYTSEPTGQHAAAAPAEEPQQDAWAAARSPFGGAGTSLPPVWGPDTEEPEEDDWEKQNAGKRWARLGGIAALCLLVVVAIVVAFNLGRDSGGSDTAQGTNRPSASPNPKPQPVQIAAVDDFDPEGDPSDENPELVPRAVDGDPSTAWRTMTYFGDPHLGLLKSGVGLLVDLGKPTEVSSVRLSLVGEPTSLKLLAAPPGAGRPSTTDGLKTVARASDAGTDVNLEIQKPVKTRYLVVWLTSLPAGEGGYVGQIAEINVLS
ncbi:MAG TPA: protein kinase family protein [Nocardioidaceae bacterium]